MDDLLAQIDTGEVALTGEGGLLPGLIKLALERGLAGSSGCGSREPADTEMAEREGPAPQLKAAGAVVVDEETDVDSIRCNMQCFT